MSDDSATDSGAVELAVGPAMAANEASVAAAAAADGAAAEAPNGSTTSESKDDGSVGKEKSRFQKDAIERFSETPAVMALGTCAPVTLEWKDVVLKVTDKKGNEKAILDRVSGFVQPGELVAVIGASGAGKTSLLNCLARRNTNNTGSVTVNGAPFTQALARRSAYVQQEDIFLGSLTVEEHLRYQAELGLPATMSPADKDARVEQLIASLSLTKCRSQLIGNVAQAMVRGISGGERKRLAFASEILTDPSLLFADEPTSGLDSYMAEGVVMALRQLAAAGRTVIATIHQPSSEVYQLFDKVIFLAEGRVAYFGDREGAVDYFASMSTNGDGSVDGSDRSGGERDLEGGGAVVRGEYTCPQYSNPADFFIRVLAKEPPTSTDPEEKRAHLASEAARIAGITDAWDAHVKAHPHLLATRSRSGDTDLSKYKTTRSSWCRAFSVLTRRSFLNTIRDPVTTRARFAQAVFLGLMGGLIYFQLGNEQVDIQNKNGAIFFLLINQCMSAMFGVLQVFPLERPVFMREYESGMYDTGAYFLAKCVSDLPSQLGPNFVFITVAWWMIDMRDDVESWLLFLAIVVMAANAATSLGYVISTATPSVTVALALGPAIILPFMLFAGFFVNTDSIPDYFKWLEVLSFFKYGFSTGVVSVWDGVELNCPAGPQQAGVAPCMRTGTQVLDLLNQSPDNKTRDFIALAAMVVGYRLVAYFVLLYKVRRGKRQNE
mmetsp:Transcript_12778/g.44747  ORF Transcript_12778/g.44747 Transcript_12778/m.44747 type:complete len:720 (-) Transcript_12778:193-2352(-)